MATTLIQPDVSLVVIAYNERRHATECVRAILAQKTDAVFDVVFVDDGSTDGTADLITATGGHDERLHVIRLPDNRGRGAARAAGVEAARGHVIGFVDADITLPPDWLRRCLEELTGHAAVSGIAVPDGDTTTLARISGATPREVAGSTPITGNNVLFDRAVFDVTGFDPRDRLGEDFRLAVRLQRAGHRLRRVPGLTVRHEESKTYGQALRWRFANGIDAATHPRELGVLRFADLVWVGWVAAWIVAVAGTLAWSPWWLLLGVAATVGAGVMHATTRFHGRPISRFLVACLADVPLLAAYLLGRTVGAPRLILGRPAYDPASGPR